MLTKWRKSTGFGSDPTNPPTLYKAKVLEDVKEAADELNMVLSGNLKARDEEDLLNEL